MRSLGGGRLAAPSSDIPVAWLGNGSGVQGGLNEPFVAHLSQSESHFVLSVVALELNENNKWCPYLLE